MMKTICTSEGCVHVEMSAEEAADFLASQEGENATTNSNRIKYNAFKALTVSDMVAIRCLKSGVDFPDEWKSYVSALRSIISGVSDHMPIQPEYPLGT